MVALPTFKIRRNFLLALGLTLLLLLVLLGVCVAQQEKTAKIVILVALTVPVLAIFAESVWREIRFLPDGLVARRLLRSRKIAYDQITAVDTVRVRRRIFVSLSTEADFLIFSNNYENFAQLLDCLQGRIPPGVVSEETRELRQQLPLKNQDLFSVWFAALAVLLVLYVQLGGSF
ncbi:MAG: hypothetical protein GW875_16390 [Deltaproteobacteria bacterium]|nr:hypothetical protein [Deltaproteobacteria bacterium]